MAYVQNPKYNKKHETLIPCRCGSLKTETVRERGTPKGFAVHCKTCGLHQVLLYESVHAARKAWIENPDEPLRGKYG